MHFFLASVSLVHFKNVATKNGRPTLTKLQILKIYDYIYKHIAFEDISVLRYEHTQMMSTAMAAIMQKGSASNEGS